MEMEFEMEFRNMSRNSQIKCGTMSLFDSMDCSLYDGVLFSMQSPAKFMPFTGWHMHVDSDATNNVTVNGTGRRSIITRCKHMLVPDNDCTHSPANTVRPQGGEMGHAHKILVPCWLALFCH